MGWEYTDGKPQLYSKLSRSTGAPSRASNPPYWTWAMGTVWYNNGDFEEEGVKYTNDTNKQMKIGSVSIKTCSCHSGGKGYWAWGGHISDSEACVGWGGRYYCYVMVSNDGGETFQTSSKGYHDVPPISSTNMNSPGYDGTHTASFGNPPYTGYSGLTLHEYVIPDCPIIEPGGIAFVQFGIASLTDSGGNKVEWADTTYSQKRKTVIRFVLNPTEMEVQFDPETAPYVWKFFKDTSKGDTVPKWHLVKPVYIYQGNTWKDIEEKG